LSGSGPPGDPYSSLPVAKLKVGNRSTLGRWENVSAEAGESVPTRAAHMNAPTHARAERVCGRRFVGGVWRSYLDKRFPPRF
jgi:hypothetical protein